MSVRGWRIRVRGQVQGVGFRPFVWTLAQRFGLRGRVLNDAEGVLIDAAGAGGDAFAAALRDEAPPLARVDDVEMVATDLADLPAAFEIVASTGGAARTRVTPDAATCPACLAEIAGDGRRAGYAFTNCTHCGPRFSILNALPYDRAQTSMAGFTMCADCAAEYADPADRRFHAQPIACPVCGPRLWLERDGAEQPGDAIALAAQALRAGQIVAVMGLGGVHLACDARNDAAVERLRARKRRPTKPFALMGDMGMIRACCAVSDQEEARLADPAAPILLLDWQGGGVAPVVAPGQPTLGWMLPYTPLHHLLLERFGGPLVMTSGNLSGEPQVTTLDGARSKLAGFADAFLLHDRPIARRLDDSVERITPHGPMVLRHARGRAPGTTPLPPGFEDRPEVLAMGGQMKGALCLSRGAEALLSHHLGDLDDALTWDEYQRAMADYAALFDHSPARVAVDLHEGFRPTQAGRALGLPVVAVQHHHAHLAACMGEHGWPRDGGAVAAIVLDGLGLGPDGTIWGGELLLGDYRRAERIAWLAPAPLPGGDAAQAQPWRNAMVRLDIAGLGDVADRLFAQLPRAGVRHAVAQGLNAPRSSSAGRLFDAVAALLGLCPARQSHEAEAAMALEALAAAHGPAEPYPCGATTGPIATDTLFRAIAADLALNVAPGCIAARFHASLAEGFCAPARALVDTGRAEAVALTGGCFQNAVLLSACMDRLAGYRVLQHQNLPANDGSLAFGQVLVALAQEN
ncbi:carbamoyltransferase HypF [Roseovarius sp.]|uniref:carbamoyltransferase HypF n=1 Tax=Roseovarius sp. TaxID=1486281 RepID=UPI0035692999